MDDETRSQITRLIQSANEDRDQQRDTRLFDRYMGEPYGDEKRGRSAFVSTDTADAVEAILPDLMDVFTSSEQLMEFAPVGAEDEAAAQQETTAVSHIFWQKNPGFEILYTWIKDALIEQNAYVKRGWEEKRRTSIEVYEGLDPDELASVLQAFDGYDDVQILEQSGGLDEETGTFELIDIKLRCVKRDKSYVIEPVPHEEFFISPRWNRLSLDGVTCCGHRSDRRLSELRAMGFDQKSLDEAGLNRTDTEAEEQRFDTRDVFESDDDEQADRRITVYEAYVLVDIDGDGIDELVQVWAAGDGTTILKWADGREAIEEVTARPFSVLTPYLVPHRHVGRSVVELVDDIQQVKSILIRHTLDSLYTTNYPRPMFDEHEAGPETYNDLLNPAHGAPVRTGGANIEWTAPQSVITTTLPLLETFEDLKELRVGATRYNQGLNTESLNKTASGVAMMLDATQKKMKLIARLMAETGLRDLFLGIHADLRAGPVKDMVMKLRGEWVTANPREWAERTDMTVQVGLGTGQRDQRREALMLMGQLQRELMTSGSRMVDEKTIYNTAERIMETFGFKTIAPFLHDPAQLPPAPETPEPPDPSLVLAEAQIQNMQAETARRTTETEARLQVEQRKVDQKDRELAIREMELHLKQTAEARADAKTAADIQTDDERLELEQQKAVMEDDFKRDKLEVDALTGFHRSTPEAVETGPPVDYGEVVDDAR